MGVLRKARNNMRDHDKTPPKAWINALSGERVEYDLSPLQLDQEVCPEPLYAASHSQHSLIASLLLSRRS